VSYTYQLTDRAVADLKKLNTWLQEETLDEIEVVTSNPTSLAKRLQGAAVHDFVRKWEGNVIYVFITIIINDSSEILWIREIGSYQRAIKGSER
jgi:hypothetical protein